MKVPKERPSLPYLSGKRRVQRSVCGTVVMERIQPGFEGEAALTLQRV